MDKKSLELYNKLSKRLGDLKTKSEKKGKRKQADCYTNAMDWLNKSEWQFGQASKFD